MDPSDFYDNSDPTNSMLWQKIGVLTANELANTEKKMVDQIIAQVNLKDRLSKLNLGYAVSLCFYHRNFWGRLVQNKKSHVGSLNESVRIPNNYISAMQLFLTRDGQLMTIDDGLGGLTFINIFLLKAGMKINIFSKTSTIFQEKGFPNQAIENIENVIKQLSDPITKLAVTSEYNELLDSCYLRS